MGSKNLKEQKKVRDKKKIKYHQGVINQILTN